MADFSKFKIGNTSYNVKDANAGKSLSVSGSDLSLKNAAGTAISTVTLPSGGGAYIILTGAYNSMFSAFIISSVVSDAGHTITTMQDLYDAIKNDGAIVYLVDETNNPAEIIPLSYIYENALDPTAFDVGFVGVTKGWVSTRSPSDTLSGTPWTAYSAGGGSSAPDAIIGTIAVDMNGQNINASSFSAITNTPIAVDTMTKLRLSVKCPQGWPTDVGSLTPIACAVKAGSGPVYDTIQAAVDAGAGASITEVGLFYEWKPGSWIKVSLNATYNSNGSITITNGSAAAAATLIQ